MVKSDLARSMMTNPFMTISANIFMNLAMKTTEGGARTPVLAALTKPEEHGMNFTNYMSNEEYES